MKPLHVSKATPRRTELDRVCMIREGGQEYCIYPLDRVMVVLGKKWTLFMIGVLGNAPRMRFNEIQSEMRFVSSRTLADRLKELESLGLVDRKSYDESPPRVEYTLTKEGRRLRTSLIPLLSWAIDFESAG